MDIKIKYINITTLKNKFLKPTYAFMLRVIFFKCLQNLLVNNLCVYYILTLHKTLLFCNLVSVVFTDNKSTKII